MNINKDKGSRTVQVEPEAFKITTSESKVGVSLMPQKEVKVIEKEKAERAKAVPEEPGRMSFALLARERKLTPARQVVLKRLCKWDETTKITAAELDAAIKKHLKGEV